MLLSVLFYIFLYFSNFSATPSTLVFQDLTADIFTELDSSLYSFYDFSYDGDEKYFSNSNNKTMPPIIKKSFNNSYITQCGSKSILGGPGIFGIHDQISIIKLQIPNPLPSHSKSDLFLDYYNFSMNSDQRFFVFYADPIKETNGIGSIHSYSGYCGTVDIINKAYTLPKLITNKLSYLFVMINGSFPYPNPVPIVGYGGIRNIALYFYLCDRSCAVCTTGNFCLLCPPNTINNASYNSSCICGDGYYWNKTCSYPYNITNVCDWVCSPCPMNCSRCTINQCLACKPGYVLTLDNLCLRSCPFGSYAISSICYLCDSSCADCAVLSTSCTSCSSTKFLYQSTCIYQCPVHTYTYIDISNDNQINCINCDSTCNTCYGAFKTQCLSCSNTVQYMCDGYCMDACPIDRYQYEPDKLCILCHSDCYSCTGLQQTDCIQCSNQKAVLYNNMCVLSCPDDLYPIQYISTQSPVCSSCGSYCNKCIGPNKCGECMAGYYNNKTSFSCNIPLMISFYIIEISNPTTFLIVFSHKWQYIEDNYNKIMTFSLNSSRISVTKLIIQPSASQNMPLNSYILYFSYNDSIESNDYIILTIGLSINYNETDNLYHLAANSSNVSILLDSYIYTKPTEYYSQSTNKVAVKPAILSTLSYTDQLTTEFILNFAIPISNLSNYVKNYSKVEITGFSTKEFDYKITEIDRQTYNIKLDPHKNIVLYPQLKYSLNIPLDYLILNNINNDNSSSSISLYDYYLLSSSDLDTIDLIKSMQKGESYASQSTAAVGTILSSGNPLFLQGIMLSQMVFLLRFTKIEFPPNLIELFKSTELPTLIFFYNFEKFHQDQKNIPSDFIVAGVSPYFLDNCGELICKNAAIILISIFLLQIPHQESMRKNIFIKFLSVIRVIAIWEIVLFFFLENLLKFSFFTIISLLYPPLNSYQGEINYAISAVFVFLIFCFILHIYLVITKCQNIKAIEEMNTKHKMSIFSGKDSPMARKDSPKASKIIPTDMRKTKIFDEETVNNIKNAKFKSSFVLGSPILRDISDSPKKSLAFKSFFPNENENIGINDNRKTRIFDDDVMNTNNKLKSSFMLSPTTKELLDSPLKRSQDLQDVSFNMNNNLNNNQEHSPPTPDTLNSNENKNILTPPSPDIITDENDKKKSKVSFKGPPNTNDAMKELNIDGLKSDRMPQKFRKAEIYDELTLSPQYAKSPKTMNLLNFQPFKFLYNPKDTEQYLNDHLFLHEEVTTKHYLRYFILFDYIRQITISLLIAVMRPQPLAQMVTINLINTLYISIMFIYRPFIHTYCLLFCIVNELITAVSLLSILGLAIMDICEDDDFEKRLNLGWAVIYANVLMVYWIIISSTFTIIFKIIEKVRSRKKIEAI